MTLPDLTAFPSIRRSRRMIQRNLIVYKHAWMIIFSGFFEPLFYLLGIGIGLGSMIGLVDGIPYSAFVAPGLLVSSCMNGAITDGFFNIWFKLHHEKTYDGILATPMRVGDIAFGEMLWAVARGSLYAATFIAVVFITGLLSDTRMILSPWAVLVVPAALLASGSLSSLALCATTFVRKVQDFDTVMGLAVLPMFLFSGIFFPVSHLPTAVQWLVSLLPLYNAIEIVRSLTTGRIDWSILGHVLYLIAVGAAAFSIAMRRLERSLMR
jgi:lipooligosaccharide transport system permease protein